MKDSDAVKLIVLCSIGSQLNALQEVITGTDYHEYPAFDDETCALLDAVYASVKDSNKMIQSYIESTGLDEKMINAIEGNYED